MVKREKKIIHKFIMTEEKRQIAQQFLHKYDMETSWAIQDARQRNLILHKPSCGI